MPSHVNHLLRKHSHITTKGYSKFRNRSSATSQAHKGTRYAPTTTSGNCGGHYPHDGQCPAAGKTCNLCRKPNHFATVCRSTICRNCGGHYPHDGQCPAAGKTCKSCHKPNHFDTVCRSKARAKQRLNVVEDADPVDSTQPDDDDYCFPVSTGPSILAVTPKTKLKKKMKQLLFTKGPQGPIGATLGTAMNNFYSSPNKVSTHYIT